MGRAGRRAGVGGWWASSTRNLPTPVCAFPKQGRVAPALYDALAAEAAARVRTLNPQGIANLAWAFARAGHKAPRLFEVMAAEAVLQIDDFNAQDLTNTAWAYAKVGHPAGTLFDAIAAAAPARATEFTAQALANMAWAYASGVHPAPALFDEIAGGAPARVGEAAAGAGQHGVGLRQRARHPRCSTRSRRRRWEASTLHAAGVRQHGVGVRDGGPRAGATAAIADAAAPRTREFKPQESRVPAGLATASCPAPASSTRSPPRQPRPRSTPPRRRLGQPQP